MNQKKAALSAAFFIVKHHRDHRDRDCTVCC